MKTYVLTISQTFPQTHPRKGEPTYFPGQILDQMKIHTIRSNFELWEKRIKEVNAGEAILSVRHWYGKPYRSPQIEFTQFESVGIEKVEMSYFEKGIAIVGCQMVRKTDLAKNDGLSFDDFQEWFRGYDLTKPMAIIHFTNFRYSQ